MNRFFKVRLHGCCDRLPIMAVLRQLHWLPVRQL